MIDCLFVLNLAENADPNNYSDSLRGVGFDLHSIL